jgi:hypothetical protein
MNAWRHFHALWDKDEGRIALFLNVARDDHLRLARRYDVYHAIEAEHGGRREYLGVFDASKPPAADWRWLPPWILLPLFKSTLSQFTLTLEPVREARQGEDEPALDADATPLTLHFDRGIAFDYRRRLERGDGRFYGFYAETMRTQRTAQDQFRSLRFGDQERELGRSGSGHLPTQDAFVSAYTGSESSRVRRIMAYAVRGGRIGPALTIYSGRARPVVRVAGQIDKLPPPREEQLQQFIDDNDKEQESLHSKAFRHMVFAPRTQPRLTVRLADAANPERAERLRQRLTFLHVPMNLVTGLMAARSEAEEGDEWMKTILRLSETKVSDPSDPLAHCVHKQGSQLELRRIGGDLVVEYPFENVSVGDLVGVVVHDQVRLALDRGPQQISDGADRRNGYSSLYLRFLIDRLRPMNAASIRDEEHDVIEDVLNRSRLRYRPSADEADEEIDASDDDTPDSAAGGLRLGDLLWPACQSKLVEEDGRRRNGRQGRLREIMLRADFDRVPNIAHAMCTTEKLGDRLRERGRRPTPDAEKPLCATILGMLPDMRERTLQWAKGNGTASQQSTIWRMIEIDPYFADWCARTNVTLPRDHTPEPEVLRAVHELRNKTDPLRRAAQIYAEYGREEEKNRLLYAIAHLEARTSQGNGQGPSLDELQHHVEDVQTAEALLRGDFERMLEVLRQCQLPVDRIDQTQVHIAGHFDTHAFAAQRQVIQRLLHGKAAPQQLRSALDDLDRIQSPGVLALLASRLEQVEADAEILRVVVETAEHVTRWANYVVDGPPGQAGIPPLTLADWTELSRAIRAPGALPDQFRLERLAAGPHAGNGLAYGHTLAAAAAALKRLVEEAHAFTADRLARTPGAAQHGRQLAHDLAGHFESLEVYGGIALATLVTRTLRAGADHVYSELATLAPEQAARAHGLLAHWNGLGRCLAPDRALIMLPEALGHARELFREMSVLKGSGGEPPEPHLPNVPTFAQVRERLPA